jgi:hypothetical protein
MSQESLVRLKQINNPELSGYILSVVTQGSQAAGLQYFRLSSPSAGTFLYDSTNNFYEQGFQFGYPSNIFLIDFYGTSNIAPVPYGKPYIYGFDIYGGAIFSSGNRVITTVDTGNFISYGQLLRTSGSLVNTLLKYCYPNLPTSVTNGNIENTFLPYGIDLNNEWLIGDDTIPSIDWQNRVLSGDWNVQSLTIGGQPVTTGGQNITGDFITSAQTGQFYSSANPSGFLTKNNVYSFKTTLISGINSQTISYGQTFVTPPLEVSCTFQNDVDNYVYSYAISSVNTSGFIIGFSDYLSNGGYILNTQINF